ncbi:MAG: hypothetical protein ACLULH_04310 [Bacteroides fragilis]
MSDASIASAFGTKISQQSTIRLKIHPDKDQVRIAQPYRPLLQHFTPANWHEVTHFDTRLFEEGNIAVSAGSDADDG